MPASTIVEFFGRGEARLYGSADNVEYVGHRAPATVTTQYDITWPAAAPAGARFMQIDAAGLVSFVVGVSGTLDAAYDSGGAGAGRVITTDTGPLELAGVDGLRLNTTNPKIEFETDIANFNWRIVAALAADNLLFQLGALDADISDDVFVTVLSIDSLRMVGVNTANPQEALHVTTVSGDAKIRIQAILNQDASIVFMEDSTSRFEVGYDDSAGGFVLALTDFATTPVMFVEDAAGDVGFGTQDPDSNFHIATAAGDDNLIVEAPAGSDALITFHEDSTDRFQVGYDDSEGGLVVGLGSLASPLLFFEDTTGSIGIGTVAPASTHQATIETASATLGCLRLSNTNAGSVSNELLELEAAGNQIGIRLTKTGAGSGSLILLSNSGTGNLIQSGANLFNVDDQGLVGVGNVSDGTRPAANTVDPGTIAWSTTDTQLIVSDGTDWRLVQDNTVT